MASSHLCHIIVLSFYVIGEKIDDDDDDIVGRSVYSLSNSALYVYVVRADADNICTVFACRRAGVM